MSSDHDEEPPSSTGSDAESDLREPAGSCQGDRSRSGLGVPPVPNVQVGGSSGSHAMQAGVVYEDHLDGAPQVSEFPIVAPVAYTEYGKTISHYGGLRIAPYQAIYYAGWGKAKQLAWDRAYDKDGELCYICYYDAGNSAYAGFMKSILTPEGRSGLCYTMVLLILARNFSATLWS